jgi:hypothetical protein
VFPPPIQLGYGLRRQLLFEQRKEERVPTLLGTLEPLEEFYRRCVSWDTRDRVRWSHIISD